MERVVVPALEAYRPDLIVVACGFDANALDYLLKPIDPFQLQEAVEKAGRKGAPPIDGHQLENLIQSLATQKLEKITISSAEGLHFVEVPSIIRIEGEGNYATIYLQGGD